MSKRRTAPVSERDRVTAEHEDLMRALLVERQRPVPPRPAPLPAAPRPKYKAVPKAAT